MIRYSVACRGSLNTNSAKCFQGGGWWSDVPFRACPHCGRTMFVTQQVEVLHVEGGSDG